MHLSSKPRASFSLALFRLYFLKNGFDIGWSEFFGIHKYFKDAVCRLAACPCRRIGNVLPMGLAFSGAWSDRLALVCGFEMERQKAADLTEGLKPWPTVVGAGSGALALWMARCTASALSVVADGIVSATLWLVVLGVHLRRRSIRGHWCCIGELAHRGLVPKIRSEGMFKRFADGSGCWRLVSVVWPL